MIHPTNNKNVRQKILWHLKVFLGAIIISIFFSFVLNQKLVFPQFMNMLVITFLQLEIFIWLGTWFFQSLEAGIPGFKKKMLIRLVLFYFLVLFIALSFFLIMYSYYFFRGGGEFSNFWTGLFHSEMKGFFSAALIGFSLGALFFFYVQWADALKREQKLTREKLIYQYETLKRQVNPHFLFNSLNSLSSLVKKDPDLSEKFIQKLSSVYRYILENEEIEMVPLSTELEFVSNFFYLQKIRDEEKISLKVELNGNGNVQILPVSIQLLVENALKHNSATRKNPLEITIHFEGLDKLVVRNNLQKKTQLNGSSKKGLKNLNERCKLILQREIEVLETNEEFVVKVPVRLN